MALGTTGELFNSQGEIKFEWKIKDFLKLDSGLDEWYESPEFSFCGTSWVVQIYPYGTKLDEAGGYISLSLEAKSIIKPVTIIDSYSIKTADEKSAKEFTSTTVFQKENPIWGWAKFILRSDLIKRKSELLPSDALTIICILKKNETNTENTYKDATTQTIRAAKILDASSQTKEGIGVWKLQQHLHEISLNGDTSDIILKVDDQEFKSHRCILAARSPVFSAMMKNKMKENVTGIVHIEDVDPEIFSEFLSYLYTGSTEDLTSENVPELYTIADKYQVEVLKQHCLEHMLTNVSIENFCDIFVLSQQYDEENLKSNCIQYFVKHSLNIVKTSKWQSFLCKKPIIGNELFIKHLELHDCL